MTPDEKFLVKMYQNALAKGDAKQTQGFLRTAKEIGEKESAARNAIKLLAKANMVIKMDDTTIQLTDRGCNLAKALLEEKKY